MQNVTRVTNYSDVKKFNDALRNYRVKFEDVFFERFLNRDLIYTSGLDKHKIEWIDTDLRAPAWSFSSELRAPMHDVDPPYWSEEQCFEWFKKRAKSWEAAARRRALIFWKLIRSTLEQYGPFTTDVPTVDSEELEGFRVILKGFEPKYSDKLSLIRAGLRLYRERAQKHLPLALQVQLPINVDFEPTLDKGGEYLGREINLYASSCGKPSVVVHFLAHEMGHHIWNLLSEDSQTFWRTAIRGDLGELDLQEVLNNWPENTWAYDFSHHTDDPILGLQMEAITHSVYYSKDLQTKQDFQALLDKGEKKLTVPKTPISGYANKNPEEAFCEAIGLKLGYGDRALHEKIHGWLNTILPSSAKTASND
ncbi:MAG: hypothetical protein WCR20_14895 [Verrucomicrobiota bacterium]